MATEVSVPIRTATNAIEKNRVKMANLSLIELIIILLFNLETGFKYIPYMLFTCHLFIGLVVNRDCNFGAEECNYKNINKNNSFKVDQVWWYLGVVMGISNMSFIRMGG